MLLTSPLGVALVHPIERTCRLASRRRNDLRILVERRWAAPVKGIAASMERFAEQERLISALASNLMEVFVDDHRLHLVLVKPTGEAWNVAEDVLALADDEQDLAVPYGDPDHMAGALLTLYSGRETRFAFLDRGTWDISFANYHKLGKARRRSLFIEHRQLLPFAGASLGIALPCAPTQETFLSMRSAADLQLDKSGTVNTDAHQPSPWKGATEHASPAMSGLDVVELPGDADVRAAVERCISKIERELALGRRPRKEDLCALSQGALTTSAWRRRVWPTLAEKYPELTRRGRPRRYSLH